MPALTEAEHLALVATDGLKLRELAAPSVECKKAAIKQNPEAIFYCLLPDEELLALAVCGRPDLLEQLDSPSESVVQAAIQSDGTSIRFLKEERITDALCDLAISSTPIAISHLPKKYATKTRILKAIELEPELFVTCPELFEGGTLFDIFGLDDVQDEEFHTECARTAIKGNPQLLQRVLHALNAIGKSVFNEDDQTTIEQIGYGDRDEIIQMALELDGTTIQQLTLPTIEQAKIALNSDGLALQFLDDNWRNSLSRMQRASLYPIALRSNGLALEYVPDEDRYAELERIAVEQTAKALPLCKYYAQQNI